MTAPRAVPTQIRRTSSRWGSMARSCAAVGRRQVAMLWLAPMGIQGEGGQAICRAIRDRALLTFVYDGRLRIVEPYCHGLSKKGAELLRAVEVGDTSLRPERFGFGKLWTVAKMTDIRVGDATFEPDDPDYNPEDRALARIHCRV